MRQKQGYWHCQGAPKSGPQMMTEHPKSNSTTGVFYRSDVSTCTSEQCGGRCASNILHSAINQCDMWNKFRPPCCRQIQRNLLHSYWTQNVALLSFFSQHINNMRNVWKRGWARELRTKEGVERRRVEGWIGFGVGGGGMFTRWAQHLKCQKLTPRRRRLGPKRKSSLAFGTTFHPAANVGWNLLIKRIYGAGRRGQIEVVLSIS